MRDVNYGWLLRYAHANGASMFFIVVYIHIFRGLYYGSYKAPRELLWMLGVVIFLLMMATAFMGYVLPWGQMTFWGATVITNLFSAFPLVGRDIVTWLWGGFSVDNPTLNRFFSAALPAAVRDLRAWCSCTSRRCTSARTTRSASTSRARRTAALPPLLHGEGQLRPGRLPARLRRLVFFAPNARPPGQLHPGQPAGDAAAHRAGMVLPAVLRDPARGAGQAGRRDR